MNRYSTPLGADDMRAVLGRVMSGGMPEEEVREFLSTLADRGETAEEIAAAAGVLREHAVALPLRQTEGLCDTCGTGGDGHGTINVSTLAAIVAAGMGIRVVKHGNRAASSACGSADVLEALGLNLEAPPERIAASVDDIGFGFCFAPRFHPAMKHVAPARKALGRRTIFNLIGPLANPARLTYQLMGVPDSRLLPVMAEAMQRLGLKCGAVAHGAGRMDELSLEGVSQVVELRGGSLRRFEIKPQDLGLSPAPLAALKGGDAARNAEISRAILAGEKGPMRDIVVLNAALVARVAERVADMREGIAAAETALDSGKAAEVLRRAVECSHAA